MVARRDDAHAIEIREPDVRERGTDALRVPELSSAAEAHRRAGVDDEIDGEVLLFLEEAQEQSVEALVDVPIEIADVVARLVIAVIGELDAAAALLGAPFGAHAPTENPPAHDGEVVELSLKLVVEQLLVDVALLR